MNDCAAVSVCMSIDLWQRLTGAGVGGVVGACSMEGMVIIVKADTALHALASTKYSVLYNGACAESSTNMRDTTHTEAIHILAQ